MAIQAINQAGLNQVIVLGAPDISYLVGYRFRRCFQDGDDDLTNVESMHNRALGGTIPHAATK